MAAVLCYGNDGKFIINCIKSYDKICSNEINIDDLYFESRDYEVDVVPYTIRNKYFTADLHFKAHRSHEHPSFQDVLNEAECCILSATTMIDEIPLHEDISRIGEAAAELNIAVRLLVSIKNQQNELLTNAHRENRILWCLDNGFEYIEIDSLNPTQSHNLREKDGLPRLIEALNSNMWSNMERVVPSSGRASLPGTVFSSSENISNIQPSLASPASAISEVKVVEHPPSVESVPLDQQEEDIMNQLTNQLKSTQTNSIEKGEDDDNDDDKLWNTFNDVISQAREMRNEAVSGNLSDDERRRRAADMAMRLCAVMNFDESSDEER